MPARHRRSAALRARGQRRSFLEQQGQRPARSPQQQRRKNARSETETAHQGAEAPESVEGVSQSQEQEQAARLRSERAQEVRLQSQESGPGEEGSLPHGGAQAMSAQLIRRTRIFAVAAALLVLLGLAGGAAGASASSGWFLVNQSFAPTNLAPGQEAAVVIDATNVGYGTVDASATPITFKDKLPEGVEVVAGSTAIEGEAGQQIGKEPKHPVIILPCTNSENTISCPVKNKILPTESLRLKVLVKVTAATGATLTNTVTIEGGGIATTTSSKSETTSSTQ